MAERAVSRIPLHDAVRRRRDRSLDRPAVIARDSDVLTFVRNYTNYHGWAPTLREIAVGMGFKSTNSVYLHLERLQKDGLLVRGRGARALRVVME